MSEKKNSLEEFISAYIKEREKNNSPTSYAEWIKNNGRAVAEKTDEIRLAGSAVERAKSTHGSTAERLYSLGLSESGYKAHLQKLRVAKAEDGLRAAKESLYKSEAKAAGGFSDYLSKNKGISERQFRSAVNTIKDSGIINYDTAYFYAISAGLSEKDARAAASAATDAAKSELRIKISNSIVSKSLTKDQAREYAVSLGFSIDEAEEIAAYAEKISSYISSGDIEYESYLDYIKNFTE